jgi:endoglucanase
MLTISCSSTSQKPMPSFSDAIRINQLGFYPKATKQFVFVDNKATEFEIVDKNNKVVFEGNLNKQGFWEASGEEVLLGDFSDFKKIGTYSIIVDKKWQSYPFQIKNNVYADALNAAIKSYYFQRASMPIEEKYGGIYQRQAGHLDNACVFHPSSGHTVGTLNSPGGWYDAGDYGKYTVNAALSVGQMLLIVEQYPNNIADGRLNIPESGNQINDLLDELKYELDWLLTMQDSDGGVFHKITALNFSGFIMPEAYNLERMVIGKGTAATLDFAAVMAQAARVFAKVDENWAKNALIAAENAWKWAKKNNNVAFDKNPDGVSTGAYDDVDFSDDFFWAAAELFITTKNDTYLNYLDNNKQPFIHQITNSWRYFIRNNAFHSLIENKAILTNNMIEYVSKGQITLANEILEKISNNPYNIALENFEWGSNSDVLNQAMILCVAHRITGNNKYLIGAEQLTDYIFGKNATGYCFLTGFGSKKVMNPHHRPSAADGIVDPIPGFIVGGPNKDKQDAFSVKYTSNFPAKVYSDVEASFASNEVCINWNAPAVYVLSYIEQNRE